MHNGDGYLYKYKQNVFYTETKDMNEYNAKSKMIERMHKTEG